MTTVRARMTSPAITFAPDALLETVTTLLEARGISSVPIVKDGALVGIVSSTDLVGALAQSATGKPNAETARDVMTGPVITVDASDPLDEAARRLIAARVHRVVVLDRERVVGVLSVRDILEEVKARRVMAPIREIMTTPVESIEIGDSVEDAVKRLAGAGVHGLVVVDGVAPVGIFTHAEAIASRKLPASLRSRAVEDVMSYETVCLGAATPIYRAASYATAMNLRRILVVEDRHLVGILSIVDLVAVLARAAEGA